MSCSNYCYERNERIMMKNERCCYGRKMFKNHKTTGI